MARTERTEAQAHNRRDWRLYESETQICMFIDFAHQSVVVFLQYGAAIWRLLKSLRFPPLSLSPLSNMTVMDDQ